MHISVYWPTVHSCCCCCCCCHYCLLSCHYRWVFSFLYFFFACCNLRTCEVVGCAAFLAAFVNGHNTGNPQQRRQRVRQLKQQLEQQLSTGIVVQLMSGSMVQRFALLPLTHSENKTPKFSPLAYAQLSLVQPTQPHPKHGSLKNLPLVPVKIQWP